MMTTGRKDSFAVLALLAILFAFYPELFLVKAAPLTYDHFEQHFPWAFQLAQSLKDFRLPFWTPAIQCGFPLVAESQVGAFYLPNLLLYLLLPFRVAYSYMNPFHWFVAGWGTYVYAKQMKLSAMPSVVAAVVFVFGAAYGGAFYNMTSLKTICWFPVALYFLERYLEKQKAWFLVGMALVIGQSLVAGYLQMAVLTWLIFGAYAMLRIFVFPENPTSSTKKAVTFGALIVTATFALLIALPQIFLTFQLATQSNRSGLEEGYAYVGSASPLVLGTLVSPSLWAIFKGNLYSGLFSLFLILLTFCSPEIRKNKTFRIWSVMTILAYLLALGQWSPLYVALIKLTHFYSFRVPAKFLGFSCFGLAMLSAIGFQALWLGQTTQAMVKKAFHAFLLILAAFWGFMGVACGFLTVGRTFVLKIGELFVMRFVYAKPGHPHSLETYLEGVRNYPDYALQFFSFRDPVNVWMITLSLVCLTLVLIFLRKKTVSRFLLGFGLIVLMADLYVPTYWSMKPNFASYEAALAPTRTLTILRQEKETGQVGRIYGFRSASQRLPWAPAQSMLYGIEDIGAYSPLVSKRYNESIGLLGSVNDSNSQQFPSQNFVLQRLSLLGFLNVSHILSSESIEHADLKLLGQDGQQGSYLYKNEGIHQPAYFISQVEIAQDWNDLRSKLMAPQFNPKETLLLEKGELEKIKSFAPVFSTEAIKNVAPVILSRLSSKSMAGGTALTTPSFSTKSVLSREAAKNLASTIRLQGRQDDIEGWQVEAPQAGFLVISETFYPGWIATVNGRPSPILKADGLFRAIRIDGPGRYTIQFRYKPFSRS